MTLRHLQIFQAVCERGSITAAAEQLNMTQPAVSIAIRELESWYQTRLFERMNRKIYLTEAGQTLRGYADAILSGCAEAAEILKSGRSFVRCRIGVNVSVGETRLPEFLQKLEAEIPDLRPEILIDNTKNIEYMLADNRIDFAVLDTPTLNRNRMILPLYEESMVLLCAPSCYAGDTITLRELSGMNLLVREQGSGSRSCLDAVLQAGGYQTQPAAVSTSDLSLIRLAEAGLGFTLLPEPLAGTEAADGRIKKVALEDTAFVRRYYLVYSKNKYMTAALQKAVSLLQETLT